MLLLPAVTGCALGLQSTVEGELIPAPSGNVGQNPPSEGDDEPGGDELPKTSVALDGMVYRIEPSSMTVVEPAGLDRMKDRLLARDVLVYVSDETAESITFAMALGGDDGRQDPCEAVHQFPRADWTANPVFEAGPGNIDASFGGESAQLREALFGGVFDEYGFGWTDGTLAFQLDTRELDGALGSDVDACELVEALGGECDRCSDGEALCFDVVIEQITAVKAEIGFDERNDGSRCSG
ncbi:MAG: hypothetical protein FJ090_15290 [Deltaproteobacteria bacterium]|nr:hypothetical protein [Deltaproteobacteria bacterium]